MPMHTLRPDVLAEIEHAQRRQRKAEEERTDVRLKALAARLSRLEAEPRSNAPALGESFFRELIGIIRSYVDVKFGRLKNENEAIMNRLKYLEEQPSLKYERRL